MLALLHAQTLQQIQSLPDDIKLAVIQPNYRYQRWVLNEFLQDTVYVSFKGHDLTQLELAQQFQEALAHLDVAAPGKLAWVVLDECDRARESALDEFLRELIGVVQTGRVIILSRIVPACVRDDSELRALARLIPSSETWMLTDHARRPAGNGKLLEVRALGAGQVLLNGRNVENWDGELARSLLFFLVDGGAVSRNEIFEAFWPTLATHEATNVFHVTKRKIAERLDQKNLTKFRAGIYHIAPDIEVKYDVQLFLQAFENSARARSAEKAEAALQQAIALYRRDFLISVHTRWALKRRQELLRVYGQALQKLAAIRGQRANAAPQEVETLQRRAEAAVRQADQLLRQITSL